MQYKICNKICSTHIDILKQIVGKTLHKVYVDDIGEFVLTAILDFRDMRIVIRNIPIVQSDGDEYPCFAVDKFNADITEENSILVDKEVINVAIINDHVEWKYNSNKWSIDSDIAIKIEFGISAILLVAQDSLAGFIKLIESEEGANDYVKMFEGYWSMKADIIDLLERQEFTL